MDGLSRYCTWCNFTIRSGPKPPPKESFVFCSMDCAEAFYKKEAVDSPKAADNVNHPKHYTKHPSGIECIQITEHMSFTLGNAVKYIWRADLKNGTEDLEKAVWYLKRELDKRRKG